MKRGGKVFCKGKLAGELSEMEDGKYVFAYDADYLAQPKAKPVSLSLPPRREPYVAKRLFPFFHGLLAEGVLKELQCRELRIDEDDAFGRLLRTAGSEIIGDVTVEERTP